MKYFQFYWVKAVIHCVRQNNNFFTTLWEIFLCPRTCNNVWKKCLETVCVFRKQVWLSKWTIVFLTWWTWTRIPSCLRCFSTWSKRVEPQWASSSLSAAMTSSWQEPSSLNNTGKNKPLQTFRKASVAVEIESDINSKIVLYVVCLRSCTCAYSADVHHCSAMLFWYLVTFSLLIVIIVIFFLGLNVISFSYLSSHFANLAITSYCFGYSKQPTCVFVSVSLVL